MAHQIKILMGNKNTDPFTGVVSMDETFLGGLYKNQHREQRWLHRQEKNTNKGKTPVFVMINLEGKVKAFVINDTTKATLTPIIVANVIKDKCILVTDESTSYSSLKNEYMHVTVCHGHGEYVRGGFHNNTPESFNACLKRTIKGTHIHVSTKHLQKYVDEVAFRWMNKDRQDLMFETILQNVV